ncbi:hypothetical protein BB558_007457, partial [Smittium angustum]
MPERKPQNPQHFGAQRGGLNKEGNSKITLKKKSNEDTGIETPLSGESIMDDSANSGGLKFIYTDKTDSYDDFSEDEIDEGAVKMPKPSNPEAPRFTGIDVAEFLSEMKVLAKKAKLSPSKLVEILPRYCEKSIEGRIRQSPVYRLGKWSDLKQFMLVAYKFDESLTIEERDLNVILNKNWNKRTADVLLKEYKAVADYLISKKILKEDMIVEKLARILPSQLLQSGLIENSQ